MESSTSQAGSMSSIRIRVAAWDWWASRRMVSVIFRGLLDRNSIVSIDSFSSRLAEQRHQYAGGDGGADDAGHIGTHGVHQQEVAGVGLLPLHLGDPGSHGHGGHAGGADEGIDLLLQEEVHELGQQHAAGGAEAEGHHAHAHDLQGLHAEEGGGGGGGAHGDPQEDDDDVHQLVGGGLGQPVHHAGLLEQVAQHQAGDQGGGGGHQQGHEHGDHHGEDNLLTLADFPQGPHDDLPLGLGG